MATPQFERFQRTLRELFMLDQADLDFGIYRIMNEKRRDIEAYLNTRLPRQVKELLAENTSNRTADLQRQLNDTIAQLRNLGVDPETNQKVKDLRNAIAAAGSPEELESTVYAHLATFFSRYYEGGDFISLRRYKKDVYAIPYEGEEVKLHWANADQYYIKTGEYFRTYSFTLDDGKRVEFTLKEASTEQNNNLAQNNMERRFAIYAEEPLTVDGDTLHINFTYELYPKATKQKALLAEAYNAVKDIIPSNFYSALAPRPTDSDRTRTLLLKHLNDYVARNTFDYFIHKDLKGFLSRELDFYIKNEILFIDDINARSTDEFVQHLSVIKAVKAVGASLIQFLAQLEDFQKHLWLKKKFVVQADYCITLDRVPTELYAEICRNDRQREEWVRLFAIDEIKADLTRHASYSAPLTEEFLAENPFLVLDTQFFSTEFKHRLLSSIPDLDEQTDGLLINSENFQAVNLLSSKYKEALSGIYIDPPYNTDATPIIYKNGYKDSTWLSLMNDRIRSSMPMLVKEYFYSLAIDDAELHNLYKLLENNFINSDLFQCIVNHYPGSGTGRSNVSKTHEYNIFVLPKDLDLLRGNPIPERERTRGFCRSGTGDNNFRHGRPNSFYAVLVNDETKEIIGVEPPPAADDMNYPKGRTDEGYLRIYPLGADGAERCWSLGYETAKTAIKQGMLKCSPNNVIHRLYNDESDWELLPSLWVDSKYSAVTHGTNLLTKFFGKSGLFSFPKSIYTVMTAIYAGMYNNLTGTILDFFAGSGTTGHAVINLNREDGGQRKYILVEMGSYFDTVTKPRIEKVIYSKDWNNGKPVSRDGSSHCFKYMRLEQYEDTLNNLTVQPAIEATEGEFFDGFLLGYMLDTETRDSLFNLKWFVNPFDVKLRITRNNETNEENIDMVETFNYLIGLNVAAIAWPKPGICVVEGRTRQGKKTLVIWRDRNRINNEALNDFFTRSAYSVRDNEYDIIYVNGDNNLENLRTAEDTWKVTLIEQEFNRRMFE